MTATQSVTERLAADARLTRREKGLLIEMIGKGRPVTREELEQRGQGRIATLHMLQKLTKYGYIRKVHTREDGKPMVHYHAALPFPN